MSKHIGVIGHFGGNSDAHDGQTVKTKILVQELKKHTDATINIVDTYYRKKTPIRLFIKSIFLILREKKIIVLLSYNGQRFFFPLLYFVSTFLHKEIYHDVIGGILDIYVERNPHHAKYLSSFKINWVETNSLKQRLAKQGITNVEVIPNFKRLPIKRVKDVQNVFCKPIKYCTFSRVIPEKGIEDAILAIERINNTLEKKTCHLDIYGFVEEPYRNRFHNFIKKYADSVTYKGVVAYNQSTSILGDYYALLFPTYWKGEGIPGTVIDALFAGLPVIATDWNDNKEIVRNGSTGILYTRSDDNLYKAIKWSIENVEKMNIMRFNCLKQAEEYLPDRYIKKMVEELEL